MLIKKISDTQWGCLLDSAFAFNMMLIYLKDNPEMRSYLIAKIDPTQFKFNGVTLALVFWKLDEDERIALLNRFTFEQLRPALETSTDIYFISSALESTPTLQKLLLSGLNVKDSPFKASIHQWEDAYLAKHTLTHIQDPETRSNFIVFIQEKIRLFIEEIRSLLGMPESIQHDIVRMSQSAAAFINGPTQTEEADVAFTPEEVEALQTARAERRGTFFSEEPDALRSTIASTPTSTA